MITTYFLNGYLGCIKDSFFFNVFGDNQFGLVIYSCCQKFLQGLNFPESPLYLKYLQKVVLDIFNRSHISDTASFPSLKYSSQSTAFC